MADIGNGHQKPPALAGNGLGIDRIVKVAGIFAVNRDKRNIAQVNAAFEILRAHLVGQFLGKFERFFRKFMWHIELAHCDFHFHARVIDPTQHFHHSAHGRRVARGRIHNFNGHDLACLCPHGVDGRHNDIVLNALVFRHHNQNAALIDQTAHQVAIGVLEHFQNHGLGPAASIHAHHARTHAIAMHGFHHFF